VLRFNTIPLYGCLILSLGTGLLVALFTYFLFAPHLRRRIDKEFELDTRNDLELVDDANTQKGNRWIASFFWQIQKEHLKISKIAK
jgi:hypothetical protein